MDNRTHALKATAKRLSGTDRRRTLGVVIAVAGAISMASGLLAQPAAADESYVCPAGNYLSWTDTFDPPASVVTVPNFEILFIGFGLVEGGHVTYGDGTSMRGETIDVIAAIGEPATDAHWCKAIVDSTTTTTIEETTTTVEETTTTIEETTTTVGEETTTTVGEETTTTVGEETTTTVGEETTTTVVEGVTTTTDSESGGPTTTTLVEITTTTDSASGAVTTTIANELPRTGPDEVRAFMTIGALMMLMGGVLVLRSRRDVEFG